MGKETHAALHLQDDFGSRVAQPGFNVSLCLLGGFLPLRLVGFGSMEEEMQDPIDLMVSKLVAKKANPTFALVLARMWWRAYCDQQKLLS